MKKIIHFTIAGLAWLAVLATPQAKGWTYGDGDVLLIFRNGGSEDVEFDIGNVSQFLNHPNGYSAQVTDWSQSLVNDNISSVSGASVILTAVTSGTNASPSAWLSSEGNVTVVNDVTLSAWHSELYSIIDAVGADPTNYNLTPASANGYAITAFGDTTAGQFSLASYDYVVSEGGQTLGKISEFGGNVPFDVEGVAPATLGFWQIQPSSVIPKPAATYIGTFDIDANGNLYFYVGSLQPTITKITQSGNVSTVSFTTLDNGSYSLAFTSTISGPVSTWPVVSGPVAGDAGVQSLSYTNSGGSAGYYAIVRSP
jgi:hypothetical protein